MRNINVIKLPMPGDLIRLGMLQTYTQNELLMRMMERSEVELETPFLNIWYHPMFKRGWSYITGEMQMSMPLPFDVQTDESVAADISKLLEGDKEMLETKVVDGARFEGRKLKLIFDVSGREYEGTIKQLEQRYAVTRLP